MERECQRIEQELRARAKLQREEAASEQALDEARQSAARRFKGVVGADDAKVPSDNE